MAESILTADRLREMLHYDPEAGAFTWKVNRGRNAKLGQRAGTVNDRGYRVINVCGRLHREHRLAFLYMTGAFPDGNVDHRNGRKTDNRWSELRAGSQGFNLQNQRSGHAGSASRFLGVSWHKKAGKWRADICVNKKQKYLGLFDREEDAAAAYLAHKRVIHPACTI